MCLMTTPNSGEGAGWSAAERLQDRERDPLDEAVRRFSSLSGDVRPALADRLGLSATELRAVEHVMTAPIGPVELARRLGLTSAAATTLVRRLEGRGHLERSSHPEDGRRIELRATAHAYTEIAAVLVPLFDGLETARKGMSDGDRDVTTRYLETVSDIIEGHLQGAWRRRQDRR